MLSTDRCNTVPIEKGTETLRRLQMRRLTGFDATPSPSRRGLKRLQTRRVSGWFDRCNTVPIEKGTETKLSTVQSIAMPRCNTVPIEKGTETVDDTARSTRCA